MGNPLLDKDFLRELDLHREKEIYARVTSLDINEQPIEYIEGRVTGGSINIDGSSAVRRTCNLTLFTQDVNINEFYWGLNTKIKLEIGIKNIINNKYPEVIWFPQGIYVLTTFNTSIGTNSCTISLNGKDKGCLINGDIAGNLPSSVDFGTTDYNRITYEPITLSSKIYSAYTYYLEKENDDPNAEKEYILDDGRDGFDETKTYYQKYTNVTNTKLKIIDIIREAIHVYGKEPYENIIINDLENYGLELLQYRGDKDIYLLRTVRTGDFEHIALQGDKQYYLLNNGQYILGGTLQDFSDEKDGLIPDSRVSDYNSAATKIYFKTTGDNYTEAYTVAVLKTGETTGYRMTDLIYVDDLISGIGETLTSMLDKIKNMLGDFEYFYDIDGHFVFQRKKTFINTSWNNLIESNGERFAQSLAETSAASYSFEGNILITALQNAPVLNNLKNDYSIWGVRKGITGTDIPIHLRYAIHKRPNYYKAFDGKIYCTDLSYAQQILEKKYTEIVAQYRTDLADFQPIHWDEMPPNLVKPMQKANGLWTAGWWDIRDWAEYYKLVMQTDEDPKGTMKWYSYNNEEGCVPVSSLNIPNISNYYKSGYTWLVVVTTRVNADGSKSYSYNFQHGTGQPSQYKSLRTYYESRWEQTEAGERILITEPAEPRIQEYFGAPYNGCSDNHTYLYFLNYDVAENRNVYFYNPKFPGVENIEELIEEEIRTGYQEFLDAGLINVVDWREIIYQMAIDYYRYNKKPTEAEEIALYAKNGWDIDSCEDNFLITLRNNNKMASGDYLYPTGYTGYEQYYPDMQGFWRQLYCPLYDSARLNIQYKYKNGSYSDIKYDNPNGTYDIRNEYVEPAITSMTCDFYLPEKYKTTLDQEIADRGYGAPAGLNGWATETAAADCHYASYFNDEYAYWARNVIDDPAALNFWIDFLDTGELGQFDVSAIGARQKAINDKDVTCIYNKEVPTMVFVGANESFTTLERKTGYAYCKLNTALDNLFAISAQGKSAKDMLDELLYQYSYCIENITITSIPIYYLEPNTRIFVHDDDSHIDGDYIVTKFTLPLAYNGTMSITANKAPQRIY